jgi:5-methylcytosine-specific restriction enzyme A
VSSWGQGGTRNWRHVRQEVLERDHYECQLRLHGCIWTATEVHHRAGLMGLSRAEAVDCDDCMAVCAPCHGAVTRRQAVAAQQRLNAVRAARRRLPVQRHPGEMTS